MYGCEGIAAQRVCEVSQTKEMTVYEEIIMIDVPEYPRNERTRTNEMSKYTMKNEMVWVKDCDQGMEDG